MKVIFRKPIYEQLVTAITRAAEERKVIDYIELTKRELDELKDYCSWFVTFPVPPGVRPQDAFMFMGVRLVEAQ